jgi:hypothetical protein
LLGCRALRWVLSPLFVCMHACAKHACWKIDQPCTTSHGSSRSHCMVAYIGLYLTCCHGPILGQAAVGGVHTVICALCLCTSHAAYSCMPASGQASSAPHWIQPMTFD